MWTALSYQWCEVHVDSTELPMVLHGTFGTLGLQLPYAEALTLLYAEAVIFTLTLMYVDTPLCTASHYHPPALLCAS